VPIELSRNIHLHLPAVQLLGAMCIWWVGLSRHTTYCAALGPRVTEFDMQLSTSHTVGSDDPGTWGVGALVAIISAKDLDLLFKALRDRDYLILGPTARDGAIVYDELASADDLPTGWTDEQEAGTYRLKKSGDDAMFGYTVGPHSWKKFLHPPVLHLWSASRNDMGFQIDQDQSQPRKMALIGVRPCELSAIQIQDRVFLDGPYVDTHYKERREGLFIVAVNCGRAGATCFCASMGTGPRAKAGYDLSMTEVLNESEHYFLVQVGSQAGADLLAEVPHHEASRAEITEAENRVEHASKQMGRSMDTIGLKELLDGSYEHPRWDEVAERCLACGNCTMVCPTCFCTSVEDTTDLTGTRAERTRKWDSCFTADFSYIHGGSVRSSPKSRYRQWLTHKLATWQDQFGTTGCVGCGRCITWCPVGIDITKEVRAIRATDAVANEPVQSMRTPTGLDEHTNHVEVLG
jgi:sulfhydrogenase subunit beta (sulfur reductase)